jgi:CheY-like chemotaxis protein
MISVLYVDDENTLLEVTRVYLERTGDFSVTTCLSAQEALALLKTRSFDAIVSDYQMPVMDGLLFLRSLRDSGDAVPFILFTGKGREQVAIEALNTGADFYLQKGGDPKSQYAELMSKIRQVVQRRQAELALAASEEKYRDLVENINDVIFSVDTGGMITYISPRFSQFGYAGDQVIGTLLVRRISTGCSIDLERYKTGSSGLLNSGSGRHPEKRVTSAPRAGRYLRGNGSSVSGASWPMLLQRRRQRQKHWQARSGTGMSLRLPGKPCLCWMTSPDWSSMPTRLPLHSSPPAP